MQFFLREANRNKMAIVICCVLTFLYWDYVPLRDVTTIQSASGIVAGVSATILGFMVTAISIITALSTQELIVKMKGSRHYDAWVSGSFFCCGVLLLLVISCIVLLFMKAPYIYCLFDFCVFLFLMSGYFAFQAGSRFYAVIVSL